MAAGHRKFDTMIPNSKPEDPIMQIVLFVKISFSFIYIEMSLVWGKQLKF